MTRGPSSREPTQSEMSSTAKQASQGKRATMVTAGIIAASLVFAYVIVPLGWVEYEHRHPGIDDTPGITTTGDDHPGDPINVALTGSEADLEDK